MAMGRRSVLWGSYIFVLFLRGCGGLRQERLDIHQILINNDIDILRWDVWAVAGRETGVSVGMADSTLCNYH